MTRFIGGKDFDIILICSVPGVLLPSGTVNTVPVIVPLLRTNS